MRSAMVERVYMSSASYQLCLTHALSAESEEVMGLLIGYVSENVVHVCSAQVLLRLTKEKDRVEISPEQLSLGMCAAEELSISFNRPLQIVGWYHSHPHITVQPSHVDIATQQSYETLDKSFIGVIFSVFNADTATGRQRAQCGVFQSAERFYRNVPLVVQPSSAGARLPQVLRSSLEEERLTLKRLDAPLITRLRVGAAYVETAARLLETIAAPLHATLAARKHFLQQAIKDLESSPPSVLNRTNGDIHSDLADLNLAVCPVREGLLVSLATDSPPSLPSYDDVMSKDSQRNLPSAPPAALATEVPFSYARIATKPAPQTRSSVPPPPETHEVRAPVASQPHPSPQTSQPSKPPNFNQAVSAWNSSELKQQANPYAPAPPAQSVSKPQQNIYPQLQPRPNQQPPYAKDTRQVVSATQHQHRPSQASVQQLNPYTQPQSSQSQYKPESGQRHVQYAQPTRQMTATSQSKLEVTAPRTQYTEVAGISTIPSQGQPYLDADIIGEVRQNKGRGRGRRTSSPRETPL